ncbi:MAG: NTP transferase domain-containing protein [Anaerolineales bacterium]|nr:NTP transferase domain-containing protein [Anaerolineales bacterium]
MKTVAIVQARMASTRLPGKVLAEIAGQPMLYHVIQRTQQTKNLDLVVVATSTNQADDAIAQFCQTANLPFFRGSENDVLDRYYQTAHHFEADTIVRLTADCPLLDPEVIAKVVQTFQVGAFDYVSNTLKCTYPDGLDTEVFSLTALTQAWQEALLNSEREHVTPYIWKNPTKFRLGNVVGERDLSALRWTIDEPQDLAFVRAVYEHLGSDSFGMAAILNLLETHPHLSETNAAFERNEGYQKSLREDKLTKDGEAQ